TKGVAVGIFVKTPKTEEKAEVHYHEVWGEREEKYDFLRKNDVQSIPSEPLEEVDRETCLGNFHFFAPKGFDFVNEYCEGWSLTDIFSLHNTGLETQRDSFTVYFKERQLSDVIKDVKTSDLDEVRKKYEVGSDGRDWKLKSAKKDRQNNEGEICKVTYRPFDNRVTWYSGNSKGFLAYPRSSVNNHVVGRKNKVLCAIRQVVSKGDNYSHFLCTDNMVNNRAFKSSRSRAMSFPIYEYQNEEEKRRKGEDFFKGEKDPNLTEKFVEECKEKWKLKFIMNGTGNLKETFGPEDVLHYAYAVFHSPTYRERYKELLRIDFPRLQLTEDIDLL
ncbi:type ISP restriction/modification enzyme, partial [Halorubrum sp. GN11_10-6_MGM]|uniref:type ISP restriction/modification enzyme n=1 Tax=Halorubrum sp. GN11_10-6_MGM TaxID=2518112 RepID=UPI0018EE7CBB